MNPHPDITSTVLTGLGWYYLILFTMNFCWTVRSYQRDGSFKRFGGIPIASVWASLSAVYLLLSFAHFTGTPDGFMIELPHWFRDFVNARFSDPVTFFALSIILYAAMIALRKWWINETVMWVMLNVSLLAMGLSMTDYDFRQIVGKPDNVPIVAMLFIVAFFTWIYFKRAVDNDRRIAEGRPLFEQEDNQKVLVWPDLVYTELICMIALTALLIFWGIALKAPLEEAASSLKTPNPSKAPWYFLGLQEMLVYFDPWLAGVVLPSIILGGLMAIPYIDFNKRGNGYYSFSERSFAVSTFLFGFLPLWVALIVLGTFLRGPNWNFFGIYEYWDTHKVEAANNVNLSQYFWDYIPGMGGLPKGSDFNTIFLREMPGIVLVFGYFAILPPLMGMTFLRTYLVRMGLFRYLVFSNLILWMALLPIKMLLRWSFDLKYIIGIPEWALNV